MAGLYEDHADAYGRHGVRHLVAHHALLRLRQPLQDGYHWSGLRASHPKLPDDARGLALRLLLQPDEQSLGADYHSRKLHRVVRVFAGIAALYGHDLR